MESQKRCQILDPIQLMIGNESFEQNIKESSEIDSQMYTYDNSSLSESTSSDSFCSICHQGSEPNNELISPCNCTGTMANVHRECLQKWAAISCSTMCRICGYNFKCSKKIPPFYLWIKNVVSNIMYRVELLVIILIFFATPLIIGATLLSSLVEDTDSRQYIIKPVIVLLWCVVTLSWILYSIMVFFSIRFLYNSFREWQNKNVIIKILWDENSQLSESRNTIACDSTTQLDV